MTKFRKETELGPDSIQKWCEELDSKEKCEMPQDDAVILLKIQTNEKNINNDPNFKDLLTGWNATAIIHNRIKQFHTFTANNAVLMFLGCMIESPGIAVEYCNYMQYKCWQRGIKHIDMETFSRYIFPMGFFSEETLREMWDKQKIIPKDGGSLANMLDHPEFMESIREIKEK